MSAIAISSRPRWAVRLTVLAASLAIILAACGGGDDDGGSNAARNPTDPRRVPTATVPMQLPTPITALETGGPQSSGSSLPDVYVVKSGDTFGVIAAELRVTVDELVSANPNVDARSLRIGQELRVPRPTPAPAPTNTARGPATPAPGGSARPSPAASAAPSPTPARSPSPAASATPAGSPASTRSPSPAASPAGSPSASPSGSPSGAAAGGYTVESGDTACAIARKLGVSLTALAQANGTSPDNLANLRVGQTLQVPRSTGESPGC